MRRPTPGIIFASTGVSILLVLWMVTSVSAVSLPVAPAVRLQPADQVVESLQMTPEPLAAAAPEVPAEDFFVPAPAQEPGPNTVVEPVYVKPPYVNDLNQFVSAIAPTGGSQNLAGVFVQGIVALTIDQQPPGDNNWVTQEENRATIFSAAAQHGVVGLLAHNTRAGRDFSSIQPGQRIQLVYGDGSVRNFRVSAAEGYQAMDPRSPVSDFVELGNGAYMSAGDVFNRYYTGGYPLVLQTCIEQNGDSFWGRLFIVAEAE